MRQPGFQDKHSSQPYSLCPQWVSGKTALQQVLTAFYLAATLVVGAIVILFLSGQLAIRSGQLAIVGIPAPIILEFLQDQPARSAYLQGNGRALHDRLKALGVKEQIKAYYRPQIPDELDLDQYIHQLLYERTGYVGESYRVNPKGILVLRNSKSVQ